jgi:hypothetical protein
MPVTLYKLCIKLYKIICYFSIEKVTNNTTKITYSILHSSDKFYKNKKEYIDLTTERAGSGCRYASLDGT